VWDNRDSCPGCGPTCASGQAAWFDEFSAESDDAASYKCVTAHDVQWHLVWEFLFTKRMDNCCATVFAGKLVWIRGTLIVLWRQQSAARHQFDP
jgi:hypothetical protein